MPCDGSGSRHCGRYKVRSSLVALAAFEIPVRRRGATLPGRELVRIHREAHRTAWFAPLEAGGFENLVEPFRFRLELHQAGPGHDHCVDVCIDPPAVDDTRD